MEVSYEQFGRLFVERVFNSERILTELNKSLHGKQVKKPMKAGPNGVANVLATANVRAASIRPLPRGKYVAHDVHVPLKMNLDVAIGPYREQFAVDARVMLRIWVQCVDDNGLLIWIGIPDVPPQAVQVKVTGQNWLNLIHHAPGFEDELKKGIAEAFTGEIKSPETTKSRLIPIQRMAQGGGGMLDGLESPPREPPVLEQPTFEDYGPRMAPLPNITED